MTPPWEGLKLAARGDRKTDRTVFGAGSLRIGGALAVFAGIACVGDKALAIAAARSVKEAGAAGFRWTEPEAAAVDGTDAAGRFARIREIAKRAGLPVLVEVTDTKDVSPAAEAADVLLVGAANMQNFSLLKEVGRSCSKPVVIVRGWHAKLMEWLNSAEYVLVEGNPRVILCEAGIRSFETRSRVVLDLSAVPAVKAISHLPVLVDLDRAGGPGEIERLGLAAVAAGADGLVVDVALPTDSADSAEESNGITLAEFGRLVPMLAAMGDLMEGLGIDRS